VHGRRPTPIGAADPRAYTAIIGHATGADEVLSGVVVDVSVARVAVETVPPIPVIDALGVVKREDVTDLLAERPTVPEDTGWHGMSKSEAGT